MSEQAQKLLQRLNKLTPYDYFKGSWMDNVTHDLDVDYEAIGRLDPNGNNDVIALKDGSVVRYGKEEDRWKLITA